MNTNKLKLMGGMTIILVSMTFPLLAKSSKSECGPLSVQYQFRAGSSLGDDEKDFIAAINSVVGAGNVTEHAPAATSPGIPTNALERVRDANGINALMAIPTVQGNKLFGGVANTDAGVLADTYTSGLPFQLTGEEFVAWLYEGGGRQLLQNQVNERFGPGLIVIPAALGAPEHGLFFNTDALSGSGGLLPENLSDAQAFFPGKRVRLFGNGGRLMASCFGITQFNVTGGLSPYQLMQDYNDPSSGQNGVIGVDFVTARGDLYDFFDEAGVNILLTEPLTAGSLECDKSPLGDGPFGPPCPNAAQLGYKTFYAEGWHQSIGDGQFFIVDADWWNSCSPQQRNAILSTAESNMLNGIAKETAVTPAALDAIEDYIDAEGGGHFVNGPWPDAILDELEACAGPFFSNLANTNKTFKKLYNSLKDFTQNMQ